jgi:hypothetical protein
MGHAAGKLPDALHLLGLSELVLQLPVFRDVDKGYDGADRPAFPL